MTTAAAQNDSITTRNKMTGKRETISQYDIQHTDWGFRFFVDGEMEAFKAAYFYRDMPHGVKVEFARGAGRWMVTVFNDRAAAIGIDGAK